MAETALLMILNVAVLGALPTWSYSRKWGFLPCTAAASILVVALILILNGRL